MFLCLPSINLYYEKSGTGRPLILLHGNGEDHTVFDQLVSELSHEFTVYALDSRGHGKSGGTAGALDYEKMAEDVSCFISALALVHPICYGFSDGGIVGLLAALRNPSLFSGLIVSSPNCSPKGLSGWFYFCCRIRFFFTHQARVNLMLTQPQISALELQKIQCPTLLLAGEKDIIRKEHTVWIAQQIPSCQLVFLSGETHGSYVIHSKKLAPLIRNFLSDSKIS